MELSAYALETLHEDGEFILYRGRHRRYADASPLSLLLLAGDSLELFRNPERAQKWPS
jgi:predicted ATPase